MEPDEMTEDDWERYWFDQATRNAQDDDQNDEDLALLL